MRMRASELEICRHYKTENHPAENIMVHTKLKFSWSNLVYQANTDLGQCCKVLDTVCAVISGLFYTAQLPLVLAFGCFFSKKWKTFAEPQQSRNNSVRITLSYNMIFYVKIFSLFEGNFPLKMSATMSAFVVYCCRLNCIVRSLT